MPGGAGKGLVASWIALNRLGLETPVASRIVLLAC